MATFNWSTNPYFTANSYVCPIGVDNSNGGTNTPFRTLQKSKDSGLSRIHASGIFRELPSLSMAMIYFEPGSKIDGSFLAGYFCNNGTFYNGTFYNIQLINSSTGGEIKGYYRCFFKNNNKISSGNISVLYPSNYSGSIGIIECIFSKNIFPISFFSSLNNLGEYINPIKNCTFYKQQIRLISTSGNEQLYFNIFSKCDVEIIGATNLQYSLFCPGCRFKIGEEASFTILEGATPLERIKSLRSRFATQFPTAIVNFNGCIVADPLFNNPDFDDFTLQPLSPARHASYDGSFIGAKDVAFPSYAYVDDLGFPAAFYNASANANTIVANNSISLLRNADGSAVGNGEISEKPKDLGQIYELKGNQCSHVFADRNREMLDVSADIDMSLPINAGTPLLQGNIYINENGSVTYNGTIYPNRSRITAVDSVQSFSTTEGAVLYAVVEYPNRFTNLIRYKQAISGNQIVSGADVLTPGSWYRVHGNEITWDSKIVPVGDSFQAVVGKLSFSGDGVCVEEFSEADTWSEVVIDAPIKCRRVGNVLGGAIDTGSDGKPLTNGHREYFNAANKTRPEFSIYARFIQKRWILNTKMSK